MTHTLHRSGDRESLKGDYIFLAMASREYNLSGAAPKLRKIAEIFAKYNPVNMGDISSGKPLTMARGATPKEIIDNISDRSIVHAVYTDREIVKKVLRELKEADVGISVVVSGIFDEVFDACKEVSISGPFSVDLSIGIMGKTQLLPEEEILDITTMCGHGLVSRHLVKHLIEKIKRGQTTVEEAAHELAKQCVCGIFNPDRAAKLLRKILNKEK
ncbi:MAG: hypothetical protein QXQ61_00950 [Candidatus Bathyarchaeia archaeon]